MAGISAMSPALYRNYLGNTMRSLEQVSGLSPQLYSNNNNFNILKSFSGFSAEGLQAQQSDYRKQVSSFNTAARNLGTSTKAFDTTNSVFDRKYVSSNSAAVGGTAKKDATVDQYDIAVTQVAKTQRNTGTSVAGTGYGALSAGLYTVGITSGTGVEKQVTFSVSVGDNNTKILSKISSAVNGAGVGVNASVKSSGSNSYLSLESQKTGADNSFTIRDISGNALSALNLANKTQDAADAKYTVNGTSYQTASNDVLLDKGKVNLTLNAATQGTVKVSVGGDTTKTVSAVRDLIDSYNQLNKVVQDSDSLTNRGERLFTGIQAAVSGARSSEFEKIGITMDKYSGEVSLDEKKLDKALQSNPASVKRLLSGKSGLASSMSNVAKTVENAPVGAFLKPPNMFDTLNNNYAYVQQPNHFANQYSNPFAGMFLDKMI